MLGPVILPCDDIFFHKVLVGHITCGCPAFSSTKMFAASLSYSKQMNFAELFKNNWLLQSLGNEVAPPLLCDFQTAVIVPLLVFYLSEI